MPLGDLDLDRDRGLDRGLVAFPDHARAAGHLGAEISHHGQDRRRVHVDAADDEHVVAAPQHALAEARPAALARRAFDARDVTAEETHHRHRFAGERGVDQLAHRARLDLHRLARVGIDELHPYVASAAEVHALLVRALAEQ